MREDKQRLKEAQHQEKILNKTAGKQQKAGQEKRELETQLEQINTSITNMENEGGTLIERQHDIDRLKRVKKGLKEP